MPLSSFQNHQNQSYTMCEHLLTQRDSTNPKTYLVCGQYALLQVVDNVFLLRSSSFSEHRGRVGSIVQWKSQDEPGSIASLTNGCPNTYFWNPVSKFVIHCPNSIWISDLSRMPRAYHVIISLQTWMFDILLKCSKWLAQTTGWW
jgi:hypothetical protein